MNRLHRVVIIVFLLVALFGTGVYADATGDERWPYPPMESLDENYDRHVGQGILLFGTVTQVGDTTAVIEVEHDDGTFSMAVTNFAVAVQPGGVVQVYGTVGEDYTIDAQRVVVVNPAALSAVFEYGISAVAGGLFLLVFFRHWRVNLRALRLEGRDDG